MKRREFIALLGGAVVAAPLAAPLAARAQQHQNNRPRIGIIDDSPMWNPFRDALRRPDMWIGRTITFEYRRADGNPERLVAAARELAAIPVDVIATLRQHSQPRGQGCHLDRAHRRHFRRRSGADRTRAKPRAARRQHHRQHHPRSRKSGRSAFN